MFAFPFIVPRRRACDAVPPSPRYVVAASLSSAYVAYASQQESPRNRAIRRVQNMRCAVVEAPISLNRFPKALAGCTSQRQPAGVIAFGEFETSYITQGDGQRFRGL